MCVLTNKFMISSLCLSQSIFVPPGISVYLSGTDITSREASTYHPLSSNRQLTSKFLFFIYPCNSKMYRSLSCIVHFARSLCHLIFVWVDRLYVRSTVCTIIKETCEAVSRVLAKDFVKGPSCALDWEGISRELRRGGTSLIVLVCMFHTL